MSSRKISNIPLPKFRDFLKQQGLERTTVTKGKGGHEKWTREGLRRPIILQSHISPVPEFIVRQVLKTLDIDKERLKDLFK